MGKGFRPEGNLEKDKTLGREALLQALGRRKVELIQRKERHWLTEEEYRSERAKLDEEELEILTRPD